MPKSSSPGMQHGERVRYSARISSSLEPAQKLDVAVGLLLESRAIGAVADDSQARTDTSARCDRQIDPFVWHQGGHDQKMTARRRRVWMVEDRVDRVDTRS